MCQSGLFATAIQLGLLPLAKQLMFNDDVWVNAITGSTGAGVKPKDTATQLATDNMSIYKRLSTSMFPECAIAQALQNSFNSNINFIPYRGDFARGIFATWW
jgi:N-acetyl-gamma-glutamyl-phosphate reductase